MRHDSTRHLALALTTLFACDAQTNPEYPGEPLGTVKGVVSARNTDIDKADVGVLWLASSYSECVGPTLACSATLEWPAGSASECADACLEAMTECSDEAVAALKTCAAACGEEINLEAEVFYAVCSDTTVGQKTPVETGFPANFALKLYGEPPAGAFVPAADGLRAALGYIVALDPEVESPGFSGFELVGILGTSQTHMLFYAADAIPADSLWGRFIGGAIEPGYHLLKVTHTVVEPGRLISEYERLEPVGFETSIELELAPVDELEWPQPSTRP